MDENIYVSMSVSASLHWDKNWILRLGESRPELLLFYSHKFTDEITETCLSQWYPCRFEVDGVTYTSAGQYMMAEKAKLFGDNKTRTEILNTSNPGKCKVLGQKVKNFSKAVWDENKENIVMKGSNAKFMQNSALRTFLLSTGDKVLVEASPTDRIWGIGLGKNNPDALDPTKWRGKNLLGFTLMNTRDWIAFLDYFGEFDEDEEYENDGKNKITEETE